MGNVGVERDGAGDVTTKIKTVNKKAYVIFCVTRREGIRLAPGLLHSQCRLLRSRVGTEWPCWDTEVAAN